MSNPLFRTQILSKLLNNPHDSYPSIHVAGTNGKGSVCWKIAKALQYSGYRVGLYTSPHLFSATERIQVNAKGISDERLNHLLKSIEALSSKKNINLTYFEKMTLASFCYFQEQKVQVAVFETGIGGRIDATNVLKPLISVITSIGFDHTSLLGNTLEEIAREKAGIIKYKTPVVIGPSVMQKSIKKVAEENKAPLFQTTGKSNNYDQENSAVAKEVLRILKGSFTLTDQAVNQALQERPACRMQVEGHVILDVAHNLPGFMRLFDSLLESFAGKRFRMLGGFSSDKDIRSILQFLDSKLTRLHLSPTPCLKSATLNELELHAKMLKNTPYFLHSSVEEGLQAANHEVDIHEEMLLIAGSFYLMPPVQQVLSFSIPV